jgi:hypothetical protein
VTSDLSPRNRRLSRIRWGHTRAHSLVRDIPDHWEEHVKRQHEENREDVRQGVIAEYGEADAERKLQDFMDLGVKQLSILAFHNLFFSQARAAFVAGAYYPALTGACALGERILNHLVLTLRDDHKATPQYKKVYNKDSFDDWNVPIETLEAWDVLLPDVILEFRKLRDDRNRALHFRPDVDANARPLALDALNRLGKIIANQFSGLGPQPWFITGVPGEVYIKKEWEAKPFVRRVYLRNAALVGPRHKVVSVLTPWKVCDVDAYKQREVDDDEFCAMRRAALGM